MDTFTIIIAMLAAVMLSGIVVRVLPISIPIPFLQIALGVLIAAVFERGVQIEPEIFFLLFLPPLLFLDGWRVSKVAALREVSSILQLAIGLVLLTVVGTGYLIHWMIPSIPLPVAFAIAAILSPTDPVAVGAIARRVPIPRKMMTILEGEALFNDASSLVAFRFAVVAAVTGAFSLSDATLSFLWISSAGIAIGVSVTAILMYTKGVIQRRFGVEPGSDVLLSLVMPFVVYSIAERAGASGILAAVAAGICMSYVEMSGRLPATGRVNRQTIWTIVQFTLNGMMFVLLGEQLPALLGNLALAAKESGRPEQLYWLPVYAAVIYLGLILTRLVWVVISLKLEEFIGKRRGKPRAKVSRRLILAMSLAGARGSITLAGVMALPLTLLDGTPFPARELAICLAAIVLLLSLIVASISLPPLLRSMSSTAADPVSHERELVRAAMLEAASASVVATRQRLITEHPEDSALCASVTESLLAKFQRQAGQDATEHSAETFARERTIERQMQLAAIGASRQAVYRLAKRHRISDTLAREHVMWLDLQETSLLGSAGTEPHGY
ncbi:Na+/H+ antiporter [Paraburkholderia sp. Ac-20342]|uniref:Na+/H+ antiporter n=1 Tax=Paraburkholderia sp. Ac-20342 TaxID=2703889 RepID=UPI00197FE638|nr:Na+/H+ antiporter [Paraburkholderia sp. Ac-20342]MBN3846945.1 Na+/H+ antiporter [Paraburkholderia sp. Ac-20342]